jgi:hypothetical protein
LRLRDEIERQREVMGEAVGAALGEVSDKTLDRAEKAIKEIQGELNSLVARQYRVDALASDVRSRSPSAAKAELRRWRKDTEPVEEKRARQQTREQQEPKEDPMLALVADTERERDDARKHAEDLRGLLGRVLDEVEDLAPELRETIMKTLAE